MKPSFLASKIPVDMELINVKLSDEICPIKRKHQVLLVSVCVCTFL